MKKYVKKILALAIVVTMVFSLGATALAAEFTDMPASNHWAYNALNAAVTNNLLKGDNNKLNPEANLKRAEMAAIINRAFGANQAANISSYTDVLTTSWYYSDIAKAVLMGTFNGDGTSTMRPESAITRQEAFVVLARAIKLTDGNATALDKFSDKALVADWAKGALAAMVSAGYVNGSYGKLNPTGTITRQEFAQVVYNTVKSYISTPGTVTAVADGNVMVNVAGVTLKNLTVKGDLVVGDGVANGDFTLDNVKIVGRLVVRGGGKNSIKIINHSSVGDIVVSKTSDGAVRVVSDSTSSVEVVYVDDGKDGIIVEGTVTTLTIAGTTDVEIKGAVKNVIVTAEAKGAEIIVAAGATVEKLESNANNVIVSGEGKVTAATVNGDNSAINIVGTKVTVDKDAEGTTTNGTTVESGKEVVVEKPATGGGGPSAPLPLLESYIDTLFGLGIADLNDLQNNTELGFNSTTNAITCVINTSNHSDDLAISAVITTIETGLNLQTAAKKQFAQNYIATYVKSIRVASGTTLTVNSSTTAVNVAAFIISGFNITNTNAPLSSFNNNTFNIVVTDTNNNTITYTLTVSLDA